MKKNILITGPPGIGKTTALIRVSEHVRDFRPIGFYTREIRKEGTRRGFELMSLDGKVGLLAHVAIGGPYRVGKYGVDVKGFDDFLASIQLLEPSGNLIIIDEIGKMECFSATFRNVIVKIMDSRKVVITTIALRGGGFIEEVKKRGDIELFEITPVNRNSLVIDIATRTRRLLSRTEPTGPAPRDERPGGEAESSTPA